LRTVLGIVLVVQFSGCLAHLAKPKPADLTALKSANETYLKMVRWNDLRGAAQLVAPERRIDFLKPIIEAKEDENLKVLEYEVEDAQADGDKATVLDKLIWHRLPSVTTKTDAVTTRWEARGSTWFIVAIEGGPLTLEKAAPTPAAGAGAP